MLIASVSLVVIVLGVFQAQNAGTQNRFRRLLWVGFAVAVVATVAFALAAYSAKPDEGNLSTVGVRYIFAPFLFLWWPLIHVWVYRRREGLAPTESQGTSRPRLCCRGVFLMPRRCSEICD
jgi:hypothetical protein